MLRVDDPACPERNQQTRARRFGFVTQHEDDRLSDIEDRAKVETVGHI